MRVEMEKVMKDLILSFQKAPGSVSFLKPSMNRLPPCCLKCDSTLVEKKKKGVP